MLPVYYLAVYATIYEQKACVKVYVRWNWKLLPKDLLSGVITNHVVVAHWRLGYE